MYVALQNHCSIDLSGVFIDGKNVKTDQKLPLPIDKDHKFAPVRIPSTYIQPSLSQGVLKQVALGDVALLAATILTSEGEHGLGDNVRGQIITLTGASSESLALAVY